MITGFLPSQDPLQRLPYARYHLWEDLGDDLPKLLGARLGQARCPLKQLPVLSTDKLVTDAELKRAHLLLCLFAHAYVWGGNTPIDTIPEGIAKPLWEVSEKLGIPPVLGHPSIVLYNWRRLDTNADICMENLATLNNFFDGRDESWFYLITVEVEARGATSIVPMMLAIDAIQRHNEEKRVLAEQKQLQDSVFQQKSGSGKLSRPRGGSLGRVFDVSNSEPVKYLLAKRALNDEGYESPDLDFDVIYTNEALIGELNPWRVSVYATAQLNLVAKAISEMADSLSAMREGCHPFIFYHRVRPFLSGWKQNPTLPQGVIYEGVSAERQQFYGGSAAQSTLLPFLDIALGITHDSNKSRDFLQAMRQYMLRPHREFLVYLETVACIRPFIDERRKDLDALNSSTISIHAHVEDKRRIIQDLIAAYDNCVAFLQKFRTGHISLVAEYIMAQQQQQHPTDRKNRLEGSAGGKGTGGTELMSFLKPIRDDCVNK